MDQTRWSINESTVQSYRNIFISSQTFMLAVGTLSTSLPIWMFLAVVLMSLVVIWYIWFPMVRARHLIVDYYKYICMRGLNSNDFRYICSEIEYVRNTDGKRDIANSNAHLNISTNWRTGRIKIDLILPILYTVIWVLLTVWKVSLEVNKIK